MKTSTKRMTQITMLIALSIVFHLVESMIPVPVPIPGFKLGLANIVGLVALYLFGARVMLEVNIMRVIFASLLRGMLFSTGFWLSITGVLISSIAMMIVYKKSPMTIYGVSVCGSVFHSIGQVIAVTFIYSQFFMQAILPLLILLGIPTGIFIAMIAGSVLKRIKIQ